MHYKTVYGDFFTAFGFPDGIIEVAIPLEATVSEKWMEFYTTPFYNLT